MNVESRGLIIFGRSYVCMLSLRRIEKDKMRGSSTLAWATLVFHLNSSVSTPNNYAKRTDLSFPPFPLRKHSFASQHRPMQTLYIFFLQKIMARSCHPAEHLLASLGA